MHYIESAMRFHFKANLSIRLTNGLWNIDEGASILIQNQTQTTTTALICRVVCKFSVDTMNISGKKMCWRQKDYEILARRIAYTHTQPPYSRWSWNNRTQIKAVETAYTNSLAAAVFSPSSIWVDSLHARFTPVTPLFKFSQQGENRLKSVCISCHNRSAHINKRQNDACKSPFFTFHCATRILI